MELITWPLFITRQLLFNLLLKAKLHACRDYYCYYYYIFINPISPLPLLFAVNVLFFCELMLRQDYCYKWVKFSMYQPRWMAVGSVRFGVITSRIHFWLMQLQHEAKCEDISPLMRLGSANHSSANRYCWLCSILRTIQIISTSSQPCSAAVHKTLSYTLKLGSAGDQIKGGFLWLRWTWMKGAEASESYTPRRALGKGLQLYRNFSSTDKVQMPSRQPKCLSWFMPVFVSPLHCFPSFSVLI